ncbi:unnamed protein product [Urochloa decumbens]|uniref:Uncharacterized protein n=1 Tax=Urochloa decumbens TaxID=240449 RepID=A0ABC8ZUW1_9POAL
MDVWRQMAAARVPGILAFVATSMDAPRYITVAQWNLNAHIQVLHLHLLRGGHLAGQINFHDIDAYIRSALRVVGIEAEHHAMARNVFALYARARTNLEDTPEWRAWSDDHARVNAHADEATQALRAALAFARASFGAIPVPGSSFSFPRHSAGWTAWMLAAERNARLAVQSTAVAVDQLHQMRQAAMAECGNAWILLTTR